MDYSDSDSFELALRIIGLSYLFAGLVLIALYVVMSIALSMFFRKVGVPGWIAWVPYYNNWKWLEVGGFPGWLALVGLIPGAGIVTSIFLYLGMWRTGIAFRKTGGFLVLGIFLPYVWLFILSSRNEEYHPEFIPMAGFPPPIAGYGSVPRPPGSPIF
jgi:hypothetical protein